MNINSNIHEKRLYTMKNYILLNKSKQELIKFNYKSYNIGLLIYDTYIRVLIFLQ